MEPCDPNSAYYEMLWRFAQGANAFESLFKWHLRKRRTLFKTMPPIHNRTIWD